MRSHFDACCASLFALLATDEHATVNLAAEETLFVRFNRNRVRQATDVEQAVLALQLQRDGRTVDKSCTLSGHLARDRALLARLLQGCREEAAVLPADPNQVPVADHGSSEAQFEGQLLSPAAVVAAVAGPAQGCDLAGLYAGGTVLRGNRNSRGQSHWFATRSFFFDYSLYDGPRAAKGVYAGATWDAQDWAARLQRTRAQLALLGRPPVRVAPGAYRSYLAPQAFSEFIGMLGWGALSAAAWKQGRSPLKKLVERELRLSPQLQVQENFGLGLTPRFNDLGETSSLQLPLIADGEVRNLLTSSRSAREYGLVANGAGEGESPRALDVRGGTLDEAEVLPALGTGIYLSNLHYLNWSDIASARVTGMTRYACFWVQDGEIAGPLAADLRWDQSLYEALSAEQLLALTRHTEIDPATGTYSQRSLGGSRVPGALVEGFRFTL